MLTGAHLVIFSSNVEADRPRSADIRAFVEQLKRRGIACSQVADEGWCLLTEVSHARPQWK